MTEIVARCKNIVNFYAKKASMMFQLSFTVIVDEIKITGL